MTAAGRWGWRILVGVAGLLALNGVALYAFIVDTHQEQTIGLLVAGHGILALLVAVAGLRGADRWAWNASWALVATLGAIGLHMLRGDRADLVLTYGFLAAVALTGQLLARRDAHP
jgi:hypothetical protein